MKIKLDPGAYMPERAHETDAGLDLRSKEDALIPPGGSYVFDTGVHVELPKKWIIFEPVKFERNLFRGREFEVLTAGILVSKSGLNVKSDITSTGLIDSGYTGSIRVKLYNHGKNYYPVHKGDKISQLVILPILTPTLEVVDKLDDTDRGDGGFGSTGR